MGRRPKLTSGMIEEVYKALRLGCTYTLAAQYIGINKSTFFRYLRQGKQDPTSIYGQFRDTVMRAEAANAVAALARLQKAARDGDVRWDAWMLSRRHGYNRHLKINGVVDLNGDDSPISSEEEYRELVERVLTAGGIAAMSPVGLIVSEDD